MFVPFWKKALLIEIWSVAPGLAENERELSLKVLTNMPFEELPGGRLLKSRLKVPTRLALAKP